MSLLSILLLLSSTSPQSIPVCPLSIADRQVATTSAKPVSTRYAPGPRKLVAAVVFVGHPDKRQAIRGDDWTSKDKVRYGFKGGADVWMECHYQDSAAVLLFHPGHVRECTYTRRVDIYGGGRITCS
jgi:hypothetical protein